ncbi:hypothetical protein GGI09_002295, partial [Coemansia sp. S100]
LLYTVAEYRARNPNWTPGRVVVQEGEQALAQEPKKRARKRKPRKRGANNTSNPAIE